MTFNCTHRLRFALRILFLCYIFGYFFNLVSSIKSIPLTQLSFIGSSYSSPGRISPQVVNYNVVLRPPEHTLGYSVLNSNFRNTSFNNLPYLKNGKSILTRFWSYIKSYFTRKFPSVKTYKTFNRGKAAPSNEGYLKHTQLNPLSFFDFFDKPFKNGSEYMIKNEFDKSMSQESPYLELVRSGPSGIIKTFLRVAPAMVKDAISLTVSTLIGSFYKYSAETTIITTTDRLASLILNLQVTGYIYCNAEQRYRLSSLYTSGEKEDSPPSPSVTGPSDDNTLETLNSPDHITRVPVGDELLSYVKRLPRSYINSIFDNMNPEILDAMRLSTEKTIQLLTESVVNPNYLDVKDQSRLIIQQTGSFAMQLCFWKLALGYCMRDQETKIELSRSLNSH